jgi:hypothetical protein
MNSITINVLLNANLIFLSQKTYKRIAEEKYSLSKIKNKEDYLSRYNTVIRHLFLSFLHQGYDIDNKRVHTALQDFCVYELLIPKWKIKQIVNARHGLKYYKREPEKSIIQNLNDLIGLINSK